MDARLRVLYLLAVAVGVFFLKTPLLVGGVLAVHIGLWFAVGLPAWRLLRQCVKLWVFALLIVVSYAFTGQDPVTDHWVTLDLFGWQFTGVPLYLALFGAALFGLIIGLAFAGVREIQWRVVLSRQRRQSADVERELQGLRTASLDAPSHRSPEDPTL